MFGNQVFRARGPHWYKKSYFKTKKKLQIFPSNHLCGQQQDHPEINYTQGHHHFSLCTLNTQFWTEDLSMYWITFPYNCGALLLITVPVLLVENFWWLHLKVNSNEIGKITHSVICAADYLGFELAHDPLQTWKLILTLTKDTESTQNASLHHKKPISHSTFYAAAEARVNEISFQFWMDLHCFHSLTIMIWTLNSSWLGYSYLEIICTSSSNTGIYQADSY